MGNERNGGDSDGRKPPVHTIRFGKIRATIWENDGREGKWYSVTVVRLYQEKGTRAMKSANSFGRDDLLVAAEAMRSCYLWIAAKRSTDPGSADVDFDGEHDV